MGKKVLVVDDSLIIREFFALVLTKEFKDMDIEITTASDGWTAYGAIVAGEFDLVLTDNEMPGMWGSELVVMVRDQGYRVPFIMITGHDVRDIPAVARNMLAKVIPKPVPVDLFCQLIRETLG